MAALRIRRGLAAVTAGLVVLTGAACAPAHPRRASPPGTAHGVAVDGKLTASDLRVSGAGPG
ncbi:hypothetical protein [Amycolatopsis sp. CA-128772]|uniref:hypothetical protein n=1 Tax=Amycolatopsis sp. CA-128772 TaxID=2073159 RepID=UPI000CD1CBF6|nr:hypothetical protein [Amycolatopsis sp. CA-128772]